MLILVSTEFIKAMMYPILYDAVNCRPLLYHIVSGIIIVKY